MKVVPYISKIYSGCGQINHIRSMCRSSDNRIVIKTRQHTYTSNRSQTLNINPTKLLYRRKMVRIA